MQYTSPLFNNPLPHLTMKFRRVKTFKTGFRKLSILSKSGNRCFTVNIAKFLRIPPSLDLNFKFKQFKFLAGFIWHGKELQTPNYQVDLSSFYQKLVSNWIRKVCFTLFMKKYLNALLMVNLSFLILLIKLHKLNYSH